VFVELIESLRCPNDHEESSLIASAGRTVDRHIVDGLLGCPLCGAEYRIVEGEARFGAPASRARAEQASAETAMRLAAFLELTDTRGYAALCGRWASHADAVIRVAESLLVLVNAPQIPLPDVAARMLVGDKLPLATGSIRGIAIDGPTATLFAEAVRALRIGGRLVADASLALPAGVSELVRDDHVWVAEKNAAPGTAPRLVSLKRSGKS